MEKKERLRKAINRLIMDGLVSTNKTGVEFAFVLLPQAVAILEKYDYCIPKLPNQNTT